MLHADSIILESTSHDKDLVLKKFTTLIDNILSQFKATDFDQALRGVAQAVPDEKSLCLIDWAIEGKCKFLKVAGHLTDSEFDNYTPRIFANLSINEQFYILAHADLDSLRTVVDKPNPVFANLVYSTIRQLVLKAVV